MRLLLDNNLSPRLIDLLADHDIEHIRRLGMAASTDDDVLAQALRDGRVLISADTDFGQLLAASGARLPSVVLLRRQSDRRVEGLAKLLRSNLPLVADDLAAGAVVVLGQEDMRVRRLPIS